MTTTIINIPLDKLLPGDKSPGGSINSRRTDVPVDGLAGSIATHGLLVPLLVRSNGDGKYYVMDGNRRLAALRKVHKKIETIQVPCVEHAQGNALELSMVVNVDREELHPVDRFEVFAALVQAGETADAVAKRYGMTIKQVRQALALGRMAPEVRDAWRGGAISAGTAEAFTITADHKAQAAALKKIGKHGSAWNVRQALGASDHNVSGLLKFVGRDAYEGAGHEVNATLFSRDDGEGPDTVSDIAALKGMAERKLSEQCDKLTDSGWKWAVTEDDAPKDWPSWRIVHVESGKYTKDQMAEMGCVVGLDYSDALRITRGVVKPGDKVAIPKSPKAKKAEAKKREERKEETGGISNLLAMRLSQTLTAAVREALQVGVAHADAVSLTIAVLATVNGVTPSLRLGSDGDEKRFDNDFAKYLKLAQGKTHNERCDMLMTWVSAAVDLKVHDGGRLNAILHPGKGEDRSARLVADLIDEKALLAAARKNFDAKDYFESVSKEMVFQAVQDALGSEHAERVAKMKKGDAVKYALAHVPKTGWVPEALRI